MRSLVTDKQLNDLWVDRYAPMHFSDIVGHDKAKQALEQWLLQRSEPTAPKIALLTGSAGLGKTTLATLVLRKHNFVVEDRNASDDRTVASIINTIQATVMLENFAKGRKTALIMDECDGMFLGVIDASNGGNATSDSESASVESLIRFLSKMPKIAGPIIFIANETKPVQIRALSKIALHLKLYPLYERDLLTIFSRIWRAETGNADARAPEFISTEFVKTSGGDARRMIGQMQTFFSLQRNPAPGSAPTLGLANYKTGIGAHQQLALRAVINKYRLVCSKDQFYNVFEAVKLMFYAKIICGVDEYTRMFVDDGDLALGAVHENCMQFSRAAGFNAAASAVEPAFDTILALSDADCIIGTDFPPQHVCVDAAIILAVGTARMNRAPLSTLPERPDTAFPTRFLKMRSNSISVNSAAGLFSRVTGAMAMPFCDLLQYRSVWQPSTRALYNAELTNVRPRSVHALEHFADDRCAFGAIRNLK